MAARREAPQRWGRPRAAWCSLGHRMVPHGLAAGISDAASALPQLRPRFCALAGYALPAAVALHEDVDEAIGHRYHLARLGSGHMTAEPDEGGVAVDPH